MVTLKEQPGGGASMPEPPFGDPDMHCGGKGER
jgi:hypothetical protein